MKAGYFFLFATISVFTLSWCMHLNNQLDRVDERLMAYEDMQHFSGKQVRVYEED